MTAQVKGWCPGAYTPMQSGDGLVVRVRPYLARLSLDQSFGLAEAADRFGNGFLDLTSRGNLQIRGVTTRHHLALLDELAELGLIDDTVETEKRRTFQCTPFWQPGDLTCRLHDALVGGCAALPALPAKVGVAIDTGPDAVMQSVSADFRFELSSEGDLLLRADGATNGVTVAETQAFEALLALMDWFEVTGGVASGRMSRHLGKTHVRADWEGVAPRVAKPSPCPGATPLGMLVGVPFGSMTTAMLRGLAGQSGLTGLRVTPWRMLVLECVTRCDVSGIINAADDALLSVKACPGAPYCAQGQIETRGVAKALAQSGAGLHVSGCSKGCAHPKAAAVTLVGRDGRFDLVRNGAPWDEPDRCGLTAENLLDLMEAERDAL